MDAVSSSSTPPAGAHGREDPHAVIMGIQRMLTRSSLGPTILAETTRPGAALKAPISWEGNNDLVQVLPEMRYR